MTQIISTILFIVGLVLLVLGFMAIDSFSSDVSRFFTGTPTDKAVWLLIAGLILSVAGATGSLRGRNRNV
jgi:uncharacterized membrane protein